MMNCKKCNGLCTKAGKQKSGLQRYVCKSCKLYQQAVYCYNAIRVDSKTIISFVKEGIGIRSTSRLLRISSTTVIKRTKKIAAQLSPPCLFREGRKYEMDELRTYIGEKKRECWISYAIERESRQVIDFRLGGRTKRNLGYLIKSVMVRKPQKIFTDRLPMYGLLIPAIYHSVKYNGTNRIERQNLNLRTHLRRLQRRTLCFSKSLVMLSACLKIYFWGQSMPEN